MKSLVLIMMLGMLPVGYGVALPNELIGQYHEGSGIVAGEIEASLFEKSPFVFEYQVKNQMEKEVTLDFTSSQRFDYSVQTKDGKELFLYSSVTSFLQVLGTETVKQGEEFKYEIDLRNLNLKPGEYVLSVWMTPKEGKKYKVTKLFTIAAEQT